MTIPYWLKTTLRIQPAVILYCFVSVLSKVASKHVPKQLGRWLLEWKLWSIICLMFLALAIYAFFWQKLIKNAPIAVIYANRSSAILWVQLAAIFIFHEQLTWNNVIGIALIFSGILLTNSSAKENL